MSESPAGLPAPPGGGDVGVGNTQEKMDKSLQKENKKLRGEIRGMEMKIKAMQVELTKSVGMKDKLEGLCRELQKQNKYVKAESTAKIREANIRGKELASEVENNMGFMKSIHDNLAAISTESNLVKQENDELSKKIAILKGHYEEREAILQEALKETRESLEQAHIDLTEAKIKAAEEKENLLKEMQKLGDGLLQSREQVKEAKEVEISLRGLLENYEGKFNGLQTALKDTNGSYQDFKDQITKVTARTKDLEKETVKWQQRWEESNGNLVKMRENYQKVQGDLGKSVENLDQMKALCRTLHAENRTLLSELERKAVNSREDLEEMTATAPKATVDEKVEVGETSSVKPKPVSKDVKIDPPQLPEPTAATQSQQPEPVIQSHQPERATQVQQPQETSPELPMSSLSSQTEPVAEEVRQTEVTPEVAPSAEGGKKKNKKKKNKK